MPQSEWNRVTPPAPSTGPQTPATAPTGAPAAQPFMLWLTGLSGAGKSTVAAHVVPLLAAHGRRPVLLDGDHLREGLCADLGFGEADRRENIRRASEVAKLMVGAGLTNMWSMYGTNDIQSMNLDAYGRNMFTLIDLLLARADVVETVEPAVERRDVEVGEERAGTGRAGHERSHGEDGDGVDASTSGTGDVHVNGTAAINVTAGLGDGIVVTGAHDGGGAGDDGRLEAGGFVFF